MARRSGSADLRLHGGRVPPWPATRMSQLGAVIYLSLLGKVVIVPRSTADQTAKSILGRVCRT